MIRILVIEDHDGKWDRVSAIIRDTFPDASIARAPDLFEGEREIARAGWDLLVLDVSLDIRRGGSTRSGAAHDYTGGLKILGKMYYDEIDIPTLIITGFDSFPTVRTNGDGVVLGLEDVEREARRQLGNLLIGTVRHGPRGWEDDLRSMLAKFAESSS